MTNEGFGNRNEHLHETVIKPPAVESFLEPSLATEFWPEEVTTNEAFIEQTTARRELNKNLDRVIARLPRPDISLEKAIAEKHLDEADVAKLYDSLSKMFEESSDYDRLVLYLPFEFLPDVSWQPASKDLSNATERFHQAYMKAWKNSLSYCDVRANFVDGDILESDQEKGELPRVVKAVHLTPFLIQKGFLQTEDVIQIIEENSGDILRQSIANTLPVLTDFGFIDKKMKARMTESDDPLVRSLAKTVELPTLKKKKEQPTEANLSTVKEWLTRKYAEIDKTEIPDVTKKRLAWLKQVQKEKIIFGASEKIASALKEGSLTQNDVQVYLGESSTLLAQKALADGIRKFVVRTAKTDPERGAQVYSQNEQTLLSLWQQENPDVRDMLTKSFYHYFNLGIINQKKLDTLGLTMPKLAGPFSENMASMEDDFSFIKESLEKIARDPQLKKQIFTVALVYGSGLKGYGFSDIDTAIFVRPEVDPKEAPKLETALASLFSHDRISGNVTQFWLEKNDDRLSVRKQEEHAPWLGQKYWTHILFGAVWQGDEMAIKMLQNNLLPAYFKKTEETVYGIDANSFHLYEMERDVLQYRLMHKGYEKFYPPFGDVNTPHAEQIDGQSVFYDSGYRQLATKLFVSRVFLPKITTTKK